ncbi:unnamed protein product [Oncorhynchus mykiss]|uniref:SWIM-type domain-containing protein n=1 Tax=Oncorhynchus mykiss TaxID=8022 RepID=A0A060XD00_ONCMY|nr:unnamed protein product [Oncorhynchus mykiss]
MKMVLKHSVPVIVVQSHCCSCVAGSALCNHLVALLYQTAHYSQLNIPAAPPVHSCTDTEQHWHKPRTLGVKPGPVGGIEFRKPINSCADGIRSSLYKALNGYMPDMDFLCVSETYANFSPLPAPPVTTMEMSADVPLVESSFGPVQCGSVLSYQLPQPKTHEIVKIADAPSPPILPLDGYRLQASQCAYVLSHQEQFHLKALETTYEMSQSQGCYKGAEQQPGMASAQENENNILSFPRGLPCLGRDLS